MSAPALASAVGAIAAGADKMPSTVPGWQFEGGDAFAYTGSGASTIGDVNGDGISDFAVGAPYYTTVVGGQGYNAAVFIFFGGPNGPATTPDQTLYATTSGFGSVVAPAGDVNGDGHADLLVGHPSAVPAGSGKAYVYLGSGTASGLQTTPIWQYAYDSSFGTSVASAGDVNGDGNDDIIIGGPTSSSFYITGPGMAFLFNGNGGGVDAAPSWAWGLGGNFGTSVAGAGDVNGDGMDDVIIGAPNVSGVVPVSYQGAAFIYHGNESGLALGFSSVLWGSDNQLGSGYGSAVAGVGDINGDGTADVAVGSPTWDWPEHEDAGRAFIYPGSEGGVSDTPIWEEWGIDAGSRFGADVQPAGDVNGDGLADCAVNAPGNIVGSGVFNRYVVLVQGARAGFSVPLIEWYLARNDGTDFGSAIGTAGDVNDDGFSDLIVGSATYFRGTPGMVGEGRAEIFFGAGTGPRPKIAQSLTYEQNSTYYAWVTTTIGDVNGDGYSDVAVTGPGVDVSGTDNGIIQIQFGSSGGLLAGPQWAPSQASGSFGYSAAAAGDVNGDGYDDIIIGAPLTGLTGRAYCWFGGPFGPSDAGPEWGAEQGGVGAWFGCSVSGAGDVNGDGYADVIVGALYDETDQANEGRAYLYLGSAYGLANWPVWSCEGNQVNGNLGVSVSGAGDVDGDGFDDVVVGEYKRNVPLFGGQLILPEVGRVYVFQGGQTGLSGTPATILEGSTSYMNFGSSVSTAGDVDGDGYSDILVAARYADSPLTDEGQVFVYRGSAAGVSTTAHWTYHSGQGLANLGASIACAGDVNGDGLSDVIVGANFADRNNYQDNGEAMVFAGPLTGSSATTPIWSFAGQQSYENLGNAVGSGGDINGDGFSDVLTGSPGWSGSYYGQGRMLVFYGNGLEFPESALSLAVQQRRGDNSAPMGLKADAGVPPTMRLRANARSAAGWGKLRLEWEVKPQGVMFDGQNLGRGAWANFGPLDSGPINLQPGTSIHWRARVVGNSPHQPHSRWLSPQGNGAQEADVSTRSSGTSGVELPGRLPRSALLVAAAPNPFNPSTSIRFEVPRAGQVRVDLFDLRGWLVRTLVDEARPVGPTAVVWDGLDLNGQPVASGAYHVRVEAGGQSGSVRVLLLK
jgi:hypothetical protein